MSSAASGVVTIPCGPTVEDALRRLTGLLEGKQLTVFAVVDHSGEAAKAGLTMPDTKLVIFGSPAAGTDVMVAAPLVALDLPLKLLLWDDGAGGVFVSYNTPEYLADRYGLAEEHTARLRPIVAIAEAVASP